MPWVSETEGDTGKISLTAAIAPRHKTLRPERVRISQQSPPFWEHGSNEAHLAVRDFIGKSTENHSLASPVTAPRCNGYEQPPWLAGQVLYWFLAR